MTTPRAGSVRAAPGGVVERGAVHEGLLGSVAGGHRAGHASGRSGCWPTRRATRRAGGTVTEEATSPGKHRRGASGTWRPSTCRARCPACSRSGRPRRSRGGFEAASKRYGLPDRLPGRPFRERPLLHAHAPGRRARAEAGQGEQPTAAASCCGRWPACTPSCAAGPARPGRRWPSGCWHDDLRRWEAGLRDEMLAAGRALQAEDVDRDERRRAVDHLGRVADHMVRGFNVHFDLMLVHNIPLGRLVAGCRRWGITDADALGAAGRELAGVGRLDRGAAPHRRRVPCRRGGPEHARRRPGAERRGRAPRSTRTWPTMPGARSRTTRRGA